MLKKIIAIGLGVFFLGLFLNIFSRIYQIRHNIDYQEIYSEIKDYLKLDKGEISILVEGGYMYINYDYFPEVAHDKPLERKIVFDPEPSDFIVYFYGSSSIVSEPPFYRGDFPFIPRLLESRLKDTKKERVKVYNFGIPSFDSFDTKKLIKATVAYQKPDLIISFDPATMDYESVYFPFIKKRFYLTRDFLKGAASFFVLKRPPQLGIVNKIADWGIQTLLEPNLINLAQRLNLIRVDPEPFNEYNELVLEYYKNNFNQIAEFSRNKGIPLVVITSITNLSARPYGIPRITDAYYRKGRQKEDYIQKVKYLTKAKDSEIFTGDLASKSCVYNFLTGFNKEGIYILDLRSKLVEAEFGFDFEYFYDYAHFRPALHKIITGYLIDFLKENGLI